MQPFTTHTGTACILWRENIDTDQIIPKEHLKSIKRTGFGPALFSGWRYDDKGQEIVGFALNQPQARDASILITGNNFGCGSSREHAVWAVVQFGFRAVIAPTKKTAHDAIPGFADIFNNNSSKNGLLLIELPASDVDEIKITLEKNPSLPLTISLTDQTIVIGTVQKNFSIDPAIREKLLKGLDEIGLTLLNADAITEFEDRHDVQTILNLK